MWKGLLIFHSSSEIYHVSPSCDSAYFNILPLSPLSIPVWLLIIINYLFNFPGDYKNK